MNITDQLAQALRDLTPPMPPADARCHVGLVSQDECAHCRRIAAAHAALAAAQSPAPAQAPQLSHDLSELLDTFTTWARQVAAREDVPRGIRSAAAGLHADGKRLLAAPSARAGDGIPAGWRIETGTGGFDDEPWICVRNLESQCGQDFYKDRDPLIFGFLSALAATPAVQAPAEPMSFGGIPFDATPEQFVRSLLWDHFPECCGCPTEGHPGDGYFQPPDGPQCCGCPEAVKLNDAQIVASLREQFPSPGAAPE